MKRPKKEFGEWDEFTKKLSELKEISEKIVETFQTVKPGEKGYKELESEFILTEIEISAIEAAMKRLSYVEYLENRLREHETKTMTLPEKIRFVRQLTKEQCTGKSVRGWLFSCLMESQYDKDKFFTAWIYCLNPERIVEKAEEYFPGYDCNGFTQTKEIID